MEYTMHCECYIDINTEEIVKCELCESAPALYEALKGLSEWLYGANIPYSEEKVNLKRMAKQALAQADGKLDKSY